jgi:MoxR-like ATPase
MQRAGIEPASGADPEDIGRYIRLGPLGTALIPSDLPRVLLIDEIDKGDVDLPNDLLNIFEEGEFTIPELQRLSTDKPVKVYRADSNDRVPVIRGLVRCDAFPVVVMTSNREREFPPAFLRRTLRLDISKPNVDLLREIVVAHLGRVSDEEGVRIQQFWDSWESGEEHATDQLLNALYLMTAGGDEPDEERRAASDHILRPLDERER